MSGEHGSHIVEIHLPEREIYNNDKQLLDELQESKVNVRDNQEEVKIQKVPEIMVQNEEYFKPRELSIGPIHGADSSLFKKELKLKLAAYFIERNRKTADELLMSFKAGFEDIRTPFDRDIIMSSTNDQLIRLVFLDGCAMLRFIDAYVNQKLKMFNISKPQAELIRQDLFLMENQIPFTVLDALMGNIDRVRDYELFILQFIQQNSVIPKDLLSKERFFGNVSKQPDHILGLYRRILLTIPRDSHNFFDTFLSFLSSFGSIFVLSFPRVLTYFVMEYFDKPTTDSIRRMHSFRNNQELKTAGINLKPTYSLRTLFFHSPFFITGQLSIPALVVDDSTERMLLNLVAYEMCLNKEQQATDSEADDENDSWVTSYVNLLDVVIDNEQDVKDLRAAGIIQNHLSSDNDVAQLINRMGSNCFAPSKDTYKHVKEKIEDYCRRRGAILIAQVNQSYFSNPWTILSPLAAIAALGLTAVQTYYAVNSKN